MEEALVAWLLAYAPLTNFVGQHITFATRPQANALPAVSMIIVSRLPDVAMSGRTGLAAARVQIDCWAKTYGAAKATARLVGDRLAAVKHNAPAGDQASALQGAFPQGERDGFESLTGGVGDIFRVSLDFIVWHG